MNKYNLNVDIELSEDQYKFLLKLSEASADKRLFMLAVDSDDHAVPYHALGTLLNGQSGKFQFFYRLVQRTGFLDMNYDSEWEHYSFQPTEFFYKYFSQLKLI